MSLSYNAQSVIGGKFDTGVETQLNLRKEVINKVNTRTTDDIKYLNSTTGWVRAISSVDTREGTGYSSEIARKYILQGGIPDSFSGFNPTQSSTSYTKSLEYGYIPTAGITSFQVKFKGTFGTLRTASFTFTVNSPEDFSKLEQLYLRPGFSILLEWGHSYHLSNTSRKLQPTVDIYPIDDYLKDSSDTVIESKIESLKKTSNSYNYDALFGIIKNFVWNYNGYTYECQVDVVSKGEIVESVKASMAPLVQLNQDKEASDVKYESTEYGSELLAFLKLISSANINQPGITDTEAIISRLLEKNKKLTEKLIQVHENVGKPIDFKVLGQTFNYSSDNGKNKYLSLRTFLILVNEISLLYNQSTPLVAFNVGDSRYLNSFTTFDDHFGLDLGICFLPKSNNSQLIYKAGTPQQTSASNDILDIYVSVNFLINQVESIENQSDIDATVYDLVVSKILYPIQDNLGNINYFDIATDTINGKSYLHIVDRKVIPSKQDIRTKLDLVGLASEVSNLNITSKISNNLTSMIAISAQTSYAPSSAEDLYNIQKWNSGLKDRHIRNLTTGRNGTVKEEIDPQEEASKVLRKRLEDYVKRVNGEIVDGIYIIPDPSGLKAVHKQVMGELVRTKTNTGSRTNPPGLIPFELSFTIRGISGIKVGQAFTINDFFLPERYKGRVGFIVTGVDHTVSENRWTTDLKSQMIFI